VTCLAFKGDRRKLVMTILAMPLAVLFIGIGLPKLLNSEVVIEHRAP
jgi:hypothetical protein